MKKMLQPEMIIKPTTFFIATRRLLIVAEWLKAKLVF
jgi:hypothetical protein